MRAIAFLLLLVPLSAGAQPYGPVWIVPANGSQFESTCLFADDGDTEICEVAVVVAQDGSWATLQGFRVTSTVPWTWIGDVPIAGYVTLGNSQDGADISFGSCVGAATVALRIRYACPGTSPCGELRLVTAPAALDVELETCDGMNRVSAGGGHLTVNGVFDVPFGGLDPDCYCVPVPVEKETWGRIKALYD